MKKIIPFTNDIKFNTKIYEITCISLENTLSIKDNIIDGEFIISGEYMINDSSINTEPFIHGLPFNISLDDKYDQDKVKIDIDDFKYEIVNEEILRVNIDVSLDNLELIKEEVKEEKLEPDVIIDARNDIIDDYAGINKEDIIMDTDLFKEEKEESMKVNNILFDPKDDNYVSYFVHIVRDNETIDMIANNYGVKVEDLKEYNNLDNITLKNKIIIPYINDKTM